MNNFPMLPQQQNEYLNKLREELSDNKHKVQVFRTWTEMNVSILNNAKFPTNGAKYWQSVREMDVMHRELMKMSFEYRKESIQLERLKKQLEVTENELDKAEIQVDIDKLLWIKEEAEIVAKDRVRELEHWSLLKKKYDDGTFDTKDVNDHQPETFLKQLENKARILKTTVREGQILDTMAPLEILKDTERRKILMNGIKKP